MVARCNLKWSAISEEKGAKEVGVDFHKKQTGDAQKFDTNPFSGRGNCPQCIFRSKIQTKKIKYFEDTDTLYIEFRDLHIAESKDLDENTIIRRGCRWQRLRNYI
jgi:hypothetical protein